MLTADGLVMLGDDNRGVVKSMNMSSRSLDSLSFWIFSRPVCDRHQIQTTACLLSGRQWRIFMSSSFNWLISFSAWCNIGFRLSRRSLTLWTRCRFTKHPFAASWLRMVAFITARQQKHLNNNCSYWPFSNSSSCMLYFSVKKLPMLIKNAW